MNKERELDIILIGSTILTITIPILFASIYIFGIIPNILKFQPIHYMLASFAIFIAFGIYISRNIKIKY